MKIILVRHGETNENAAHCYLGHYDAKLNEKGREQLRCLSEKIKEIAPKPITSIYSSDLSRAIESARIIGKALQLSPVPVMALRELNFGNWDCKTYNAILAVDQRKLENWIEDPFQIAPPNGETLLSLGKRVDDWLSKRLLTSDCDETIIIVSHGGPIRWFLSKLVKGDQKEFWKVDGVGHGEGVMVDFNHRKRVFTILTKL